LVDKSRARPYIPAVPGGADDPDFEATDPLGLPVTWTAEFYRRKVVGDHPDFAGLEGVVEEAIRRPNCICQDKDFADRRCYYLKDAYRGRFYIKAVAEVRQGKGRLVSAHPRSTIPDDETILKVFRL